MKNKIIYVALLLFISTSCKKENRINESKITKISQKITNTSKKDTLIKIVAKDSTELQRIKDSLFNNALFYVVIADQNENYQTLHKKMIDLKVKLNLPIDSLGRSFNKKKDLIALSENDADELYAGQYYPRRYASKYLSIEYLYVYDDKTHYDSKNMVLVTGIFENEKAADSALVVLKKFEKNAIKLKSIIYVGCMH